MSTTFSKKSKNLFFSSDVTVFSLHEQHDASLNFWFRTHIILAKIERDSLSDDAETAQHSKREVQNTRYLRGYKKQKTMSFLSTHTALSPSIRKFQGISYYTKKPSYISVQRSSLYTFKTAHWISSTSIFHPSGNNFLLPILNHILLVKPSTD